MVALHINSSIIDFSLHFFGFAYVSELRKAMLLTFYISLLLLLRYVGFVQNFTSEMRLQYVFQ